MARAFFAGAGAATAAFVGFVATFTALSFVAVRASRSLRADYARRMRSTRRPASA